jgi:hypothetical protein
MGALRSRSDKPVGCEPRRGPWHDGGRLEGLRAAGSLRCEDWRAAALAPQAPVESSAELAANVHTLDDRLAALTAASDFNFLTSLFQAFKPTPASTPGTPYSRFRPARLA